MPQEWLELAGERFEWVELRPGAGAAGKKRKAQRQQRVIQSDDDEDEESAPDSGSEYEVCAATPSPQPLLYLLHLWVSQLYGGTVRVFGHHALPALELVVLFKVLAGRTYEPQLMARLGMPALPALPAGEPGGCCV